MGAATIAAQISGVRAHGYLWIVFTLVLLILALLVGRPALERAPGVDSARAQLSLPTSGQLLVALAGLNFVVTLVGFLSKPGGSLGIIGISVGWRYGAYAALTFAGLAAAAALLHLRGPRGVPPVAPGPNLS